MEGIRVGGISDQSSQFKMCFLCSNEISGHEESSSRISSSEECSSMLGRILEVPFFETYLERMRALKSESGFKESPISYCTRCTTKFTRVKEVQEEIEKLGKMLIDGKQDIEMEFRRKYGGICASLTSPSCYMETAVVNLEEEAEEDQEDPLMIVETNFGGTDENFQEETDADDPPMMVETTYGDDDNGLQELTFTQKPMSFEIVKEVAGATKDSFSKNIQGVTEYSFEQSNIASPKENSYLISGLNAHPVIVVRPPPTSSLLLGTYKDPSSSGSKLSKPELGDHSGPVTIRKKSTSGTGRIYRWNNSSSYADLITEAIQSAPDQRMTLAQIYDWIMTNASNFKNKDHSDSSSGWKNTVRHNLSLHTHRFTRCRGQDAGRTSWWMVLP